MAAAIRVISVGILCMLAISASAQPAPSPSYGGEASPSRNVTCRDTDGKRPGCTSFCPGRCPQQCIVLCPNCTTFCIEDVQPKKAVPPPAMFVFGDGALDVGNNKYLPPVNPELGPPPIISEDSSGRLSNGANLADAVATSIGFQESPPAYLSLQGALNMLGANYASAGAGIRNSTNGERSITLSKQLEYFNATRAQMEAKLGNAAALQDMLSKSFFLVGIGGQDVNPWWNAYIGTSSTEVQDLIALYGDAIKYLYDMGARKFAIVNVGLVGCMARPYSYSCDQSLNDRAAAFDDALKSLMAGLASKNQGIVYSIADYYGFTTAVFANPAAYGLVNVLDECSTWGDPHATCSNPDEYWYWDPEFMTDKASKLTAAAFYYGPPQFTVPITFMGLLEKK